MLYSRDGLESGGEEITAVVEELRAGDERNGCRGRENTIRGDRHPTSRTPGFKWQNRRMVLIYR